MIEYIRKNRSGYIVILIVLFCFIPTFFGIIKVGKVALYTIGYTTIHLEKCNPNNYNRLVSLNANIIGDVDIYRPGSRGTRNQICADFDLWNLETILFLNIIVFLPLVLFLGYDLYNHKKENKNYIIPIFFKILLGISLFLLIISLIIFISNYYIKTLSLPFYLL